MTSFISRKIFLLLGVLLLVLIMGYFYTRGFMLHDEGYILHAAQRILDGELPYRDFDIVYSPGAPYITAFFLKMFGEKIIVARLGSMLFSLGTVVLFYKFFSSLTNRLELIVIPILVYVSWTPLHLNFSWPVIYATFFGTLTCYFLFKGQEKLKNKYFFLAGIFSIITVLFKQNFGLATFITVSVFFLLNAKIRTFALVSSYLKGVFVATLIFFIYLFSTASFYPFVWNSYFYLFKKISVEGIANTPFIYSDEPLNMLLRTMFYLVPALMSVIGIIVSFRKEKHLIFLHSFVLLFYILGIRPVTDYVHLIPLIGIAGMSLGLLLINLEDKRYKTGVYIFSLLLIASGIYTALFKGYYKWESPIIKHNNYLSDRIGVWVDEKYYSQVKQLKKYISQRTSSGDYIYVNYYSPSIYFILDRKNPTRYIYLSSNVLDNQQENEVIENLIKKNVKTVLTHSLLNNNKTFIFQFIQKNYPQKKQVGDFIVWEK